MNLKLAKLSLSIINQRQYHLDLKYLAIFFLVLYILSLYTVVDNPDLINISRVLFILLVGIVCIELLFKKEIYFDKITIALLSFLIFCFASYFWAFDANIALRRGILLTQVIILFFITSQCIHTLKHIGIVISGIAFSGVALFLYGLSLYGMEYIYYAVLTGERLGGEISQINTMGRLASFSAIIFFALGVEKMHFCYFVYMLFPLIMVLASASRAALGILLLSMVLIFLAKYILKNSYKILLILPLSIMVIYSILQLSIMDSIKLRFFRLHLSFSGNEVDGDGTLRINMVKWGWDWFIENPVWGYGIGNYGPLLYGKVGLQTYAHNNFIELLVGVGIIGFLLYYLVYVYIFHSLYLLLKDKAEYSVTMFVLFVTMVVAEVGYVSYTNKMTYVLLGIFLAYIRINKKNYACAK